VVELRAGVPWRAGREVALRGLRAHVALVTWLSAIALPVVVALAFRYPTPRLVVPESVNLLIVVLVTMLGGAPVGVVAALTSMIALWTLDLPPGFTLRLVSTADVAAVIAAGIVGTTTALVLHSLRVREQRAGQKRLATELARRNDLQLISALQQAILPEAPTQLSAVSIDCAYRTGGDAATPVGGDWYAFIPFPDGRVGIAVGDVVGHGVQAISDMAEYRFTLRTLAARGDAPHVVLDQLEDLSRRLSRTDAFTTCIDGIIDPDERSWSYANAGHPPPLLVRDHTAMVLEVHHQPPIGALPEPVGYTTVKVALQPSDTIVLYTDGVVERRGEHLDVGIDRLRQHVQRIGGGISAPAAAVVDQLISSPATDDAALVLARLEHVTSDHRVRDSAGGPSAADPFGTNAFTRTSNPSSTLETPLPSMALTHSSRRPAR